MESHEKIRLSDVVGAFVAEWNKWIRATVKRKEKDDHFSVLAIDYGVPLVLKSQYIVKLPNSFGGIQLMKKRIHVGGIENCYP